jgi:hypothetical protein
LAWADAGQSISYREMIGRIFDGVRLPRRMIAAFPVANGVRTRAPAISGANVAMGTRMMKDMTFDATPAVRDFGWNPGFPSHVRFRARPALINP